MQGGDDEQGERGAATSGDALRELAEHLERDGQVPLPWVVALAPAGDVDAQLARRWSACRDARVLARLARFGAAPTERVRAAAACARAALDSIPVEDPRAWDALGALDQWPRVSDEALRVAQRVADDAGHALGSRRERKAVLAVLTAIATVRNPLGLVAAVNSAIDGLGTTHEYGARRLAGLVRAHVPCPTLAVLVAAARK